MKIAIENFGAIKKRVEIEPRPLTIFCGSNNTGKTYVLYVLNALMDSRFIASFDWAVQHAKKLLDERSLSVSLLDWLGDKALQQAERSIAHGLKSALSRFFVADSVLTHAAQFSVSLSRDELLPRVRPFDFSIGIGGKKSPAEFSCRLSEDKESIELKLTGDWTEKNLIERVLHETMMEFYLPIRRGRTMLLPAERSGINLFFRELNSRRAALLRHVTSQTLDTNELLKDIIVSRYPQPIHDYIEFMNAQPEIKRQKSEDFAELATWLQKEVLCVKYKVDRYGDISISPLRNSTEMGLHLGSSTAKTFFGLWSYLNHLAQKGDCLMIDEPELNLHPRNQLAIARLLASLVNRGLRVIVSTHSDYMVREWGNLVMLGEPFDGRDALTQRHGLDASQWLKATDVSAYEFDEGAACPMLVSAETGISTRLFDESIERVNAAAQEIFFARQEAANT